MPRLQGRWVRIILIVVLLALIGVATYRISMSFWAQRQYDAARHALDRYDYREAAAHLETYLSVYPTDADVLLLSAQTARRSGDFHQAMRQLKLAEKNGAEAQAVHMEGRLLNIQGGDLTGADELAKYCAEDPAGPHAALILEAIIEGSIRAFDVNRLKRAVDFWLQHRSAKIDRAQGLIWRARIQEFSQDFPQALADLQEAVELAPDHLLARIRLVEALIRGEPRQAVPHLDWLRRHAANDPDVLFQSARLCRVLGQPEAAAPILDGLLAASPNKVPVLVERGRVAMDLNRCQEAERWLFQAYSLAPENREVNIALADCLRQSGQVDEAKVYQDKAQEIETVSKKRLEEKLRNNKT